MLNLVYVPKRFSREGIRSELTVYEEGKSYNHYLRRCSQLPFKFDSKKYLVIDGGNVVKNLRAIPRRKAHIIVTPKVEWGALVVVGKAIWSFALAHPYQFWAITASTLATGYSVYSALTTRVRAPNMGSVGAGLDESSPTYGWDGIKQTCDIGVPVAIIYGQHRTGGNVINEYVRTDGNLNYYHCLTSLGEGEIEAIESGLINKNPIENFTDVVVTKRYGTNDQTVIPNFEDLHNLSDSIDVELLKNDDYVYTTVDDDVEAFEIHLSLPQGLWQQDASTGQLSAWSVTYRVEYKLHAAGSYTDLGTFTISEKNRSTVRRVFRKTGLAAGQYDIRITRTSDDSDDWHTGLLYLQYIDEIKCDDLSYPNSALVAVEAMATNQLSGSAPNITWEVKGRKVRIPEVLTEEGGDPVDWDDYYWDPDAEVFKLFADDSVLYWDEETYVTAYSANPIWCCRDLITATRYGLGKFIDSALMDDSRLLEMALHCEERAPDGSGGYEKRYRLDVVIDSLTKALDLITQLTAAFNAFPYYSAGAVGLIVDKPIDLPSQEFGMGNIVTDSFVQSWKSLTEIPNVIEVTFNDAAKAYEQDTILVFDEAALAAGEAPRFVKLRVFCTRVSQAIRLGRYALYVAKYINRSVVLKASIDAILCQVGDRIQVSHDVPLWGESGRLLANNTTTTLYLDREVEVESGKTYEVQVRYGADVIETRTVTSAVGNHTSLTVSSAFTGTPEEGAVFSFGEQNIVNKPFRVMAIERMNTDEVEISAMEYNENVYSDVAVTLPQTNYSAFDFSIPVVTDLALTERLIRTGDGTIENCIDVWFTKPSVMGRNLWAYEKAKIYISDDNGASWVYRGETTGSSFSIIGGLVEGATYTVTVVSSTRIGGDRAIADCPLDSIVVAGKSAAPSDVTGFVARQSRDRMYLTWTNVADVDLSGYEIRRGDSWSVGELIATGIKQNYLLDIRIRTGTDQSYWIKAIDTSGNYSATAAEALVTIENVPFTNVIESYSEQTAWSGTKSSTETSGNNLVITPGSFLTGTYVTPVRDVGYVATFKIGIEAIATVAGDDTWQDFGEQTFGDLSEDLRFLGAEQPGALSFEIKTSEDNVTWSDWMAWQPGDYTCRYFQLRMTMTRASTSQVIECSQFNYYADLPDVDDRGEGEVTVAGDGAVITFNKEFHEVPSVNVDILSGDGYLHKFTVAPDLTDTTIKLYDLSGVAKTGTFRWHAHGV